MLAIDVGSELHHGRRQPMRELGDAQAAPVYTREELSQVGIEQPQWLTQRPRLLHEPRRRLRDVATPIAWHPAEVLWARASEQPRVARPPHGLQQHLHVALSERDLAPLAGDLRVVGRLLLEQHVDDLVPPLGHAADLRVVHDGVVNEPQHFVVRTLQLHHGYAAISSRLARHLLHDAPKELE